MRQSIVAATALATVIILSGCTSSGELASTPIPTAPASSAIPSPTPTALEGSRAYPLQVGSSRQLSKESAWSVGASAPTEVRDGVVILPLFIGIDWDNARAQAAQKGIDLDSEGVNPVGLQVRFISAAGVEYGNGFNPSELPDGVLDSLPKPTLWSIGSMYPPADSATVYVYAAVPSDQVPGGSWKVSNAAGAAVFLAP